MPELLQRHARLRVKWAQQGEVPRSGVLYLAPQGRHTELAEWGAFELLPPTGRPVPSINRLFTSVVRACGSRAVGVVLSGRLSDGAAGSRRIIEAGGKLLLQDRSTALQYDMPWASLRAGAAGLVLPPRALAAALLATMAMPDASQWLQVREGSAYLCTAP